MIHSLLSPFCEGGFFSDGRGLSAHLSEVHGSPGCNQHPWTCIFFTLLTEDNFILHFPKSA
jgi:predicted cupin superfamily sugar epimerase